VTPPRAGDGRLTARPAPETAAVALPGTRSLDLGPGVQALLAVPPGPPLPRPLLVFCHGAGGSGADALALVAEAAAAREAER
jgi:poly(3-hydroxybutyrate) depolymerase